MPRRLFPALGLLTLLLALGGPPARAADPATEAGHAETTTTVEELEEEARAEKPEILELKPDLAIATLIVFVLLLLVLWRFAWGPLARALHDREHNLEHTLQETEHARAEAERLLAEHRRQMEQAHDQVRALLEEARRDATFTADEIVKKAHAEAEAGRDRARREIESAKDQALAEIWSKTADLAVNVAGRVLSRELDHDEHRRLVETALNELPVAPDLSEGQPA